jgi:hypothetical protein
MAVAAGAAELPVAARADPAAGRDAGRQRAAADGAGDAVHADDGARAGAGARQPRRGHGAAQPTAPRRHAQGRRQVARRLTGERGPSVPAVRFTSLRARPGDTKLSGRASQDGGIWDDSRLTREEADARTKRKVEAVIKRERALAYAYSHQVPRHT